MTTTNNATATSEPFWRRWLQKIVAYEAAMDMSYDEIQDKRMDRIEAELVRLRLEVGAKTDLLKSGGTPKLAQS